MKNKIITMILMISLTLSMVACATPPTLEPVESGQQEEETTSEQTEEPVADGNEMEASEEEQMQPEQEQAQENQTLEEFAMGMKLTNKFLMEAEYEKKTEEGYESYVSSGLMAFQGKDITGTLDWEIVDLDQDNENELLAINLVQNGAGYALDASVYELKNGEVQLQSTVTLKDSVYGPYCDAGSLRILLKDDKYICLDAQEDYFVASDGVNYEIKAFAYNGEKLTEMADYEIGGSDLMDVGKEATELVDQLNTMGLHKTAAAVYDRDTLHISMADEGLRSLFKLTMQNSYLESDVNRKDSPYASFSYYEGEELIDQFMQPESNARLLTEEDLAGMTKQQLRIARNEIYARYGWLFKDEELAMYFKLKSWYIPYENITDDVLSEVELANQNLIAEMEKKAPDKSKIETPEGMTALSVEGLQNFQSVFESMEYNGFLTTRYRDVRDVHLNEVFYNGAGLDYSGDWEEVAELYLKQTEEDELFTDLTIISASDAKEFIKAHTGYDPAELNYQLEFTYIPEKDVYCFEHGDTNYVSVEVTDGFVSEDGTTYVIHLKNVSLAEFGDLALMKVTLTKNGDDYVVVSVE